MGPVIGVNWQQQNGDIPEQLPYPITDILYIVSDPRVFPNRTDKISLLRFIPQEWWDTIDMTVRANLWDRWIDICKEALWMNEPDIEATDYTRVDVYSNAWRSRGGRTVLAPYHNEQNDYGQWNRAIPKAVHCYGQDFTNADLARSQDYDHIYMTEYGIPHDQAKALLYSLPYCERTGIERVYLFTWKWAENTDKGYDIAGVSLELPVRKVKEGMAKTAYATELGPDGQGHARCGAAALASTLLSKGWESDPYQLMLEVAGKLPTIEQNGMTSQQMIELAQGYKLSAKPWYQWQEATDALKAGKHVHCLVDNWYLRPRNYPSGNQWDALHWITLVQEIEQDYYYVYDPLTYELGEYPVPYQGPTIATGLSIRLAIQATPTNEAGVIIE